MSLATRCTACGTIFRVVQDQLRVSEGWVRCGRCAEVFDAREQLFDIDREAPPPWPAEAAGAVAQEPPEPSIAPPPAPVMAPSAPLDMLPPAMAPKMTPAHAPAAPDPTPTWTAVPAPAEPSDEEIEDQPAQIYAEASVATPAPADERHEPRWIDVDEDTAVIAPLPVQAESEPEIKPVKPFRAAKNAVAKAASKALHHDEGAEAVAETAAPALLPDTSPDVVLTPRLAELSAGSSAKAEAAGATIPSFMRKAEQAQRWRRPGVRAALGLGVLLLALLLALQIAHHFRNAIGALYPQARPALQALCDISGCQLQPWRRIDALSVESSALSQAGAGNQYQLSVSLRNKSGVEVATPWIELSLTDAAGAVIARRMLPPGEFRNSKPAMAPGAELPLQLLLSTGSQKVSGYTVEIFHP